MDHMENLLTPYRSFRLRRHCELVREALEIKIEDLRLQQQISKNRFRCWEKHLQTDLEEQRTGAQPLQNQEEDSTEETRSSQQEEEDVRQRGELEELEAAQETSEAQSDDLQTLHDKDLGYEDLHEERVTEEDSEDQSEACPELSQEHSDSDEGEGETMDGGLKLMYWCELLQKFRDMREAQDEDLPSVFRAHGLIMGCMSNVLDQVELLQAEEEERIKSLKLPKDQKKAELCRGLLDSVEREDLGDMLMWLNGLEDTVQEEITELQTDLVSIQTFQAEIYEHCGEEVEPGSAAEEGGGGDGTLQRGGQAPDES